MRRTEDNAFMVALVLLLALLPVALFASAAAAQDERPAIAPK